MVLLGVKKLHARVLIGGLVLIVVVLVGLSLRRPNVPEYAPTAVTGVDTLADGFRTVTVDATDPALVVISQSYYPFWRVLVDGKPARLWRANHAFQAVEVPSGHHLVQLNYRDPFFCVGTLVSAAILLACLNCFSKRASATGGARNPTLNLRAR